MRAAARRTAALLLACAASAVRSLPAGAQELPPQEPLVAADYEQDEFPRWARDARRFEVIAVGSLPLTYFATSLVYDYSIYASHGFDPNYSMGTQRSNRDIGIMLGTAAGISVGLALADFIIGRARNPVHRDAGAGDEQ